MKAGWWNALLTLRDLAEATRFINFFKKLQQNMLKQTTCSTIIVALKLLKLPCYERVHKVCRKLYVISRQNIV